MVIRSAYWLDILKWLRNPKYYSSIHKKKYNYAFFIRILEYKTYKSKSSGIEKPIYNSLLKYIYCIYRKKDITMNFTDLNDNL